MGIHKPKNVSRASKTSSNFENLDEMIFLPSRVEPAPLSPYLPGPFCKRALAAMEAASATSIRIQLLHEGQKIATNWQEIPEGREFATKWQKNQRNQLGTSLGHTMQSMWF